MNYVSLQVQPNLWVEVPESQLALYRKQVQQLVNRQAQRQNQKANQNQRQNQNKREVLSNSSLARQRNSAQMNSQPMSYSVASKNIRSEQRQQKLQQQRQHYQNQQRPMTPGKLQTKQLQTKRANGFVDAVATTIGACVFALTAMLGVSSLASSISNSAGFSGANGSVVGVVR